MIILKLSAANSMSTSHPGISPSRWWMNAAMRAKYVFVRMMADEAHTLTHTDT